MKYRSRTGKTLSDQSIFSDLGKGTKGLLQQSPSSFGNFISGIFNYFIGVSAFISRSFLRVKLGARTFGYTTVISIYFVTWLMFAFSLCFKMAKHEALSVGNPESFSSKIYTIFQAIIKMPAVIFSSPESGNQIIPETSSQMNIFLLIILFIGAGHLLEAYIRQRKKEVIHSFYRGDSLLFGWLEGRVIGSFEISTLNIWMIVEPAFIFFVAYLIEDYLDFNEIALILKISAICLFIEEFRLYQENKRYIFDMLDGQIDAKFTADLQKEYSESIEEMKRKSPKEYKASFGQNLAGNDSKGSDSPFRAEII